MPIADFITSTVVTVAKTYVKGSFDNLGIFGRPERMPPSRLPPQKPKVDNDELSFSPGDSVEAILMKLMMRMTSRLDKAIRAQAKWCDTLSKHEQKVAAEESAAQREQRAPTKYPDPKPESAGSFTPSGDSSSTATFQLQQLSKLRETVFSALTGAIDAYANSAKKMAEKVGQ